MSEPTKIYAAGDELKASELNTNFTEALNNYRDFTLGETITASPTAVYLKASDGKVWKTTATPFGENIDNFVGFTKEAGNADDVKKVQIEGKVSGFSGLTVGVNYYLSDTAGVISSTVGTYEKLIGIAISATELLLRVAPKGIPTFFRVGDYLLQSADTSRAFTDAAYAKKKEIKIQRAGNLRIQFALSSADWAMGFTVLGQIWKNGVAIGTERTSAAQALTVYTEDITGWAAGDLIQIYCKKGTAAGGNVGYFRILVDSLEPAIVNTD